MMRREVLENGSIRLIMLIPENSKLLHLTVSIARHLSRTDNLIMICSSETEFEEAQRRHAPSPRAAPSDS